VREARLERCVGRLCPRRVCAKSDDAVVHFKEFVWCSVPILKVSEQTPEEAHRRAELFAAFHGRRARFSEQIMVPFHRHFQIGVPEKVLDIFQVARFPIHQ
jgi:hypothetical protein